jgi:uncharacterized small protein (DUF1192 family)
MTKIEYYGVNFILCKPQTVALLREEIEREEWEIATRKALERALADEDWDLYSDLFKDLHGVRPRW